jgi:prepilin-type processing-associated H-X9-DG protein
MSGTRATLRNTGTLINQTREPGLENRFHQGRFPGSPEEKPQTGNPLYVGGFSSYHPGGANFALVDGSVRFLSETTDKALYEAFGNRADGKLIDQQY